MHKLILFFLAAICVLPMLATAQPVSSDRVLSSPVAQKRHQAIQARKEVHQEHKAEKRQLKQEHRAKRRALKREHQAEKRALRQPPRNK